MRRDMGENVALAISDMPADFDEGNAGATDSFIAERFYAYAQPIRELALVKKSISAVARVLRLFHRFLAFVLRRRYEVHDEPSGGSWGSPGG